MAVVGVLSCRANRRPVQCAVHCRDGWLRKRTDCGMTHQTARAQRRTRACVLATDRTDRGRLLVALDLSKETEDAFEDAWRAELAALSPAAFSLPRAGMGYLKGTLSQSLLGQSARPAWVCAELGGTYACDIV